MAKKRPDGRYKITLTVDGKKYYFYGRTKKEAEKQRNIFKNKLQAAPNIDYTITLGQWLTLWLRGAKSTLAASTFDSYVCQLRQYILPTLAKVKLIDLQPHMFRELISNLISMGYSNRTVQYALSVVRIALRQAVNDGIIPTYPLRGVKLPAITHNRFLALTKAEADHFLSTVANPKHYNLYWIALYTGLRRSELLGLRMSDVDKKNSTLTVNQTVLSVGGKVIISDTTKNKSSHRTISIDKQTLRIIRDQEKMTFKERMAELNYENNNLLFARPDGHPYDPRYISRRTKAYGRAAGMPDGFSFHTLRHTHATLLVQAGVHFKIIQYRLGHATFAQTMDTYSHVTPAMESSVIDSLTNLI